MSKKSNRNSGITTPKIFNLSKITFSDIKVNNYGGKNVFLNYNESDRF